MKQTSLLDEPDRPCQHCEVLKAELEHLGRELTRWRENAKFEHDRYWQTFVRNERLERWREDATREIERLRQEILDARAEKRIPEALWDAVTWNWHQV